MRGIVVAPLIVAALMLQETGATVTSARASSNDGNVPKNVLDGKLGTRWSAQNNNQWIELTMNAVHELTGVSIAFFRGNQRASNFKIDVSTDRKSWQSAVARTSASGRTTALESFEFPLSIKCRYIRYTGYGNSANSWNSITEFNVVKGSTASKHLIGAVISLRKSGGDGLYLTARKYRQNQLVANAKTVGAYQKFLVEQHPWGGVALKALSNGKYLQVANKDASVEIRARGGSKGAWQRFEIHTAGMHRIALKSVHTGKFLQASHRVATSDVYPKGAKANAWETFEWSYVVEPPAVPEPVYALPDGYTLLRNFNQLMSAFGKSNGKFRMNPGYYTATALLSDKVTIMRTTGSNSIYDFTGATIDMPVKLLSTMSGAEHTHASWKMEGNGNTFIGGTFVNTYADSSLNNEIKDYKAYNEDRSNSPGGNNQFLRIWGDGATFIRNTFVVRGSFPYGYGEIYGKGGSTHFGKRKHSGILVVGNNALLDGVKIYQKAFGHALFVQGSDGTVIRNCQLYGEMRKGSEMYTDGAGSLPAKTNYLVKFPEWHADTPIVKEQMYCLNEGGIRAYASGQKKDGSTGTTGAVTIETTAVTHLRSGLALVAAKKQATVTGLHLRGCTAGFQLPQIGGSVVDSTVDAAFGPILFVPYSNVRNGKYDITLVELAYNVGSHNLAQIVGSNNDVTIRTEGETPAVSRPIMIGYSWDRWDLIGQESQHTAKGINIINYTPHQVRLTKYSSGCTGKSARVVDNGSGNNVKKVAP